MANNNVYPNSDEIEARERQFRAQRMEEEAKVRSKFGDQEERKHERERLAQEWEKMELDRLNGAPEREVWRNHLIRMYKMSQSIKDGDKSRRRASHFAAAGLRTAAQMFADRAAKLGKGLNSYSKKGAVLKELNTFNKWVKK
jgi:hypothetical protein